jgi:hypothetical protein
MPVLTKVADLAPGDRIVAVDEGMWHTREIHSITKAGAVTLLSGERMKLSDSVLAIRDVDVSETVDLTDKIDDPRDRDDLRTVDSARARCERYGLDETHPLYWDVYHRAPEWREKLTTSGHALDERDQP